MRLKRNAAPRWKRMPSKTNGAIGCGAFVLAGFAGSVRRTSAGAYENWSVRFTKRLRSGSGDGFWCILRRLIRRCAMIRVKAGQRRNAEQSASQRYRWVGER